MLGGILRRLRSLWSLPLVLVLLKTRLKRVRMVLQLLLLQRRRLPLPLLHLRRQRRIRIQGGREKPKAGFVLSVDNVSFSHTLQSSISSSDSFRFFFLPCSVYISPSNHNEPTTSTDG